MGREREPGRAYRRLSGIEFVVGGEVFAFGIGGIGWMREGGRGFRSDLGSEV